MPLKSEFEKTNNALTSSITRIIFLISEPKHILWVLKRAPETYV